MEYSKNYITKTGAKVWVRNAVALDAETVTELSNQNYQDSPFLSFPRGLPTRVIL